VLTKVLTGRVGVGVHTRAVVPNMYSTDLRGSENNSQGIRGYISAMTTLKFTYFLNKRTVLLKIIAEFLS